MTIIAIFAFAKINYIYGFYFLSKVLLILK